MIPQHLIVTIALTLVIGVLLFVAHVPLLLFAAAIIAFVGARNDV